MLPEEFVLFRNDDAGTLAVPANEHFDHVGHAAMLPFGRLPDGLLDDGIDAQIERGYLRLRHERDV